MITIFANFVIYTGCATKNNPIRTSGSAMAVGPRDALVSRNSATTKHPILKLESLTYRVALFA